MVQENTELIDYLGVIWKWKLLIILIAVVCAITSGVVSFVLPKIYQSSAILEVGRVPRNRGTGREQIEPIEDIESVSEVVESDEMLSKIKEKFNLRTTLGGIRARLDVEPILGKYIGSRLQARLIKITFEDQNPQLTVDVLNTLSDSLIKQHLQEYQASIKSLDQEIANSQEKIKIISHEIDLQNSYQKVVDEQIKVAEKAIAETKKELSQLSLKNISPLEVLFLRSTLRDQEERIADFH
jgi:capsular polysaccharide biosynthesis protein